jgi:4-amino-4-deoxy-L-arabinose transferase-like glycosyltransferase
VNRIAVTRIAPDATVRLFWAFVAAHVAAWIAETCWLVCGSVDWPLYLASQVCVAACLWAAWQMARDTLPPWPALAAALVLETSLYFTFTTPEFNNKLPAKAGWALATLAVWRGLVRHDWRWWAGAGAAFGVALLSKYDGLVLLAAFYHPERPDVFPEMRPEQAPWTSDAVLRHEGG